MSDQFHFLGMTKATYTRALLALLTLIVAAHLFITYEQDKIIKEDHQTHTALCVLKQDYEKRVADTQKFLSLSPKERTKRYGKGIGEIPNPVLAQSLRNLKANVDSLSGLSCQ